MFCLLCMLENVHNKKFKKILNRSGKCVRFCCPPCRKRGQNCRSVFPADRFLRTQSLSGNSSRTIVFLCSEEHCFLIKGERESEGGKEWGRESGGCYCVFCTLGVRQTVPDTVVGFRSNPGGALSFRHKCPAGAELGQGLSTDRTRGSGSPWLQTSSHSISNSRPQCRNSGWQTGEKKRVGPTWCAVLFPAPLPLP